MLGKTNFDVVEIVFPFAVFFILLSLVLAYGG